MRIARVIYQLGVYNCASEARRMTAREAANRLKREGWQSRPGKGSHTIYRKPGHQIVVLPNHGGDIKPGTLRNICATAGWEYPPDR